MKISKSQMSLIAVAIVIVVLMFLLPKVIVTKKGDKELSGDIAKVDDHEHTEDDGHDHGAAESTDAHTKISASLLKEIESLRIEFSKISDKPGRVKFAEELGKKFAQAYKFDSAGHYFEFVAQQRPSEKSFQKAADQYFEALGFVNDEQKLKSLSEKTKNLYEQVLKSNPSNLDAKTNLAMTYISGDNPMQGVLLLREVIAADPNNEKALYNLGVLSMQSGQYEKAVERFRKLVEVNPKHSAGTFYLGVSLFETGKKKEAEAVFEKLKQQETDSEMLSSIDEYLKKIKGN